MSQSYYGSTDPQTSPGTSGQVTYSNFNGVNAPFMKSTGTPSFQDLDVTNDLTVTGAVSVTSSLTYGSMIQTIAVTSSADWKYGTTLVEGITSTGYLPKEGFSVVYTSSDYRVFVLTAPQSGVIKQIMCADVQGSTMGMATAQIYGAPFSGTTPQGVFVNSTVAGGLYGTCNCLMSLNRGDIITLMGISTNKWLVIAEATRGSTSAASFSSST